MTETKLNYYKTQLYLIGSTDRSYSYIELYSTKKLTKEEFASLINEYFEKYRGEIITYDSLEMVMRGIISSSEHDRISKLKNGPNIDQLGEDTYPDEYKYINTHLLTKYLIKENPEFSRSPKFSLNKVHIDSLGMK